MGEGCCGRKEQGNSQASLPDKASVAASSDSCCGDSPADETKAEIVEDLPEREFSSPADSVCEKPECCRGKVGPCCDASCLDRLAVRECEADAAGTDLGDQPGGCNGATDGKACGQHRLSALDRYGATLQALGCLCRVLIAKGQETCCNVRERHSLNARQAPTEASAAFSTGSLPRARASLNSCGGSRIVTSDDALKNRLRMRKGFRSSTASSDEQAEAGCRDGCCVGDEPVKAPPSERKPSPTCCSQGLCGRKISVSSLKGKEAEAGCQDACCNDDESVKASTSRGKRPTGCCSQGTCGKKSSVPPLKFKEADACYASPKTSHVGPRDSCYSKDEFAVNPKECLGGCCGDTPATGNTGHSGHNANSDSCCAEPGNSTLRPAQPACEKSCCDEKPKDLPKSFFKTGKRQLSLDTASAKIQAIVDVEAQAAGKEHVVVSVSGMTCTGCETKLNRTLATVPAVTELRTSLVLSRAEFNIDLQLSTVEQVLKHLERTTEFKCERLRTQGCHVDFVPDEPSKFINQQWPDGVLEMTPVDKRIVRVVFDPEIVGVRDLMEQRWGHPVQLAPQRHDPSLEAGSKHVRHLGYLTLLSAALTIPVLVMAWAPLPQNELAYSSASLALATIVQLFIAGPFYPKALKALVFSGVIEMDLLIVLSTSAAYIFSVVSFVFLIKGRPLSTGQFFETSTLLVTLIMFGRWVAALARQKAVESISIRSLQASTAILVNEDDGTEREIDVRPLQYGDRFKVLPDTKIPTDGTVLVGSSEVDESMLTGESLPVEKHPQSAVIAGSVNGPGVMTVRLNRLPGDNTVNMIAAMVDEAKLSKPQLQDLADRVASYFVPVVIALTVITFLVWIGVGITVRGYSGSEATVNAITYAITVLIVSCPCAIGLAVPMVVVIASGVAAERGVIFKSAHAIEVAHNASHVVFDKTGTLTSGRLSVAAMKCVEEDKLPFLLGLIKDNRHPVSVAVAAHLTSKGFVAKEVAEPMSLTGKGVETVSGAQKLQAGNARWLNLSEHQAVQPMLAQGYTVFCFAIDDILTAVYGLQDEVRPDAAATVLALKDKGVSVHVVSGDDDGAVRSVASSLGIPRDNVCSRSSPAAKMDYIKILTGEGPNGPVVVFCGDGTNDAVALAQATIGVHMNEGTDVARSAADVVLMRPSLGGLLTMMNVSRKSVHRVRFNFAWSFVYNFFAVLLAAGALVNARIPPEYAGLGELVSVLPVIVAAVLLRWSTT